MHPRRGPAAGRRTPSGRRRGGGGGAPHAGGGGRAPTGAAAARRCPGGAQPGAPGWRVPVLIRRRGATTIGRPTLGEPDDVRARGHVADAAVRVRERRDEQTDDEAEAVDDQEEPADERAPDAARLRPARRRPAGHDQLADARAGDALQHDEIRGGPTSVEIT